MEKGIEDTYLLMKKSSYYDFSLEKSAKARLNDEVSKIYKKISNRYPQNIEAKCALLLKDKK